MLNMYICKNEKVENVIGPRGLFQCSEIKVIESTNKHYNLVCCLMVKTNFPDRKTLNQKSLVLRGESL